MHPEDAMKKIHDKLMAGHAVVIFPTGEVARSPHVEPFSIDYSKAVEGTDAAVVPFYIQGLWGSNYSYSGSNMYLLDTYLQEVREARPCHIQPRRRAFLRLQADGCRHRV